jgi:predicted secreted protein
MVFVSNPSNSMKMECNKGTLLCSNDFYICIHYSGTAGASGRSVWGVKP